MAAKRKETPAPLKPSLMLEHRAVSRPTALDKMRQHRITGRPDAKTAPRGTFKSPDCCLVSPDDRRL